MSYYILCILHCCKKERKWIKNLKNKERKKNKRKKERGTNKKQIEKQRKKGKRTKSKMNRKWNEPDFDEMKFIKQEITNDNLVGVKDLPLG